MSKERELSITDFSQSYYSKPKKESTSSNIIRNGFQQKKISKRKKTSIDDNVNINLNTLTTSNTNSVTNFNDSISANPVTYYDGVDNYGYNFPSQTLETFNFNNQQFITTPEIIMENLIIFKELPGFDKKDLKIKVVKNTILLTAERDPLKDFDSNQDEKVKLQFTFNFNEETHDGLKSEVSFKNGLLRLEVPLREDISTDIEIN